MMNNFFAALREEFTLRMREEARERAGEFIHSAATLAVVGIVVAISACIGILLR